MEVEQMLKEVKSISDKYDLLYKKTGGYFNIFEITNTAHKEVAICRVIHELISPKGSHCQGDLYLKLFIDNVLNMKDEIPESELKTAKVIRENIIKENRRVDLVIETSSTIIPIEVKIFAKDQPKQCYDYYQYFNNQTLKKVSNIFYLTRFGNNPSEDSAGNLKQNNDDTSEKEEGKYKNIICISFANNILNWLDNCLKHTNTIQIAPIREVMLQLMTVIRKFTGKMEKNKEIEMKELLNSAEKMKSAIEIANALEIAKEDKIFSLFEEIEKKVSEKLNGTTNKLENIYDYNDSSTNKAKKYYSKKHACPGISYFYKNDVESNLEVWVRLEIDSEIFAGYFWDGDEYNTSNETKHIVSNMMPLEKQNQVVDWWGYKKLLREDSTNEVPDFDIFNDAYMNLFDENKFNTFVEKCATRIIRLINDK